MSAEPPASEPVSCLTLRTTDLETLEALTRTWLVAQGLDPEMEVAAQVPSPRSRDLQRAVEHAERIRRVWGKVLRALREQRARS